MANLKNPIVRDYVSEQDSTRMVDFLMDLYTELGVSPSKGRKIEDIPQIYSEEVAGIPITFGEIPNKPEWMGGYSRQSKVEFPLPEFLGGGYGHDAINKQIFINDSKNLEGTGWTDFEGNTSYGPNLELPPSSTSLKMKRNWKNSILHEAFGHALPESLFGYKKRGEEGSELSGRSELLPYLLQSLSSMETSDYNPAVTKALLPLVKKELKKQ